MGTPPAPLELPPDPFLGPDDPAAVLVPALPCEHPAALTPTESAEACEELEDIRLFQAILAPHGIATMCVFKPLTPSARPNLTSRWPEKRVLPAN